MNIVTLDFETYYTKDYGLKKLTYEEYIADARFEVIGVAVQVNDGEPEWFSGNKEDTYNWLTQFDLENNAVLMHNAMFDASILAFHFDIYPKIILDTLCMARALHGAIVGGSLKALAQYYGVGEKGEEVHNFIGYTRSMFTPEELESYANYCKKDAQLTYYIYTRMAPYFNKTELKLIDMTIRMYTEPKFMYDREFLVAHLKEVQQRQQKLLDDLNLTHKDLRSNLIFADLLRAEGVEPPIKISATTGRETYALAKTDEGMKALLEHENVRVQQLAAARLGVKSSLEETRTQRLIDTGDRNYYYLPIGLNYYGARTGRWSATQGLQFQNLPNKSDIKQGVIAPPGYVIVGADLSNIELRVGLWFAGQMDKLKLLQDGVDLYKDFASSVFNVPYDEVTKDQRFIGKTSQLSLIYGVGHTKLRNAIKQGSGTDIGQDEAKRIVELYREEYGNVAAAWRAGSNVLSALYNGYTVDFGHNNLCRAEGTGVILPSGLILAYPNLRQEFNGDKMEWRYDKSTREIDRVYGAKVFQGTVQALARCVIGEAMVRIHNVYPLGLTLHDAVYLTVKDYQADEALKFVETEMCRAPVWLPEIILGVEGHIGKSLKEV